MTKMKMKIMNGLIILVIASVVFIISSLIWRSPHYLTGFLQLPTLVIFFLSASFLYFRVSRRIVALEQGLVISPGRSGLSTSESFAMFAVFALGAIALSFCAAVGFTSVHFKHSPAVIRTTLPK
jgi:hypothetical protein